MRKVVSAFLAVISVGAADAEPSLKGTDIPRAVADGKPWSATMANGRTTRMVFLPDGTGRFDGPMRMSIAWRIEGDRLCVRMGLMPRSRCVTLRRSGVGYEAHEGTKRAFSLSR